MCLQKAVAFPKSFISLPSASKIFTHTPVSICRLFRSSLRRLLLKRTFTVIPFLPAGIFLANTYPAVSCHSPKARHRGIGGISSHLPLLYLILPHLREYFTMFFGFFHNFIAAGPGLFLASYPICLPCPAPFSVECGSGPDSGRVCVRQNTCPRPDSR